LERSRRGLRALAWGRNCFNVLAAVYSLGKIGDEPAKTAASAAHAD